MLGVMDSMHHRSLITELTVGLGFDGFGGAGVLKFSCRVVGVLVEKVVADVDET